MVDLKEVIAQARNAGYSTAEIKTELVNKGYSKSEIDAALNLRSNSTNPQNFSNTSKSNQPQEEYSIFQIMGLLFSQPLTLFERVREKSMGKPILVVCILLIISIVITFISNFVMTRGLGVGMIGYGPSSMFLIGSMVGGIIFGFIFIFAYAGISHMTGKMVHGSATFPENFNVVVYSLIPSSLAGFITPFTGLFGLIIAIPALVFSIMIMSCGFATINQVSKGKGVTMALVPFAVFLVLLIIFIAFIVFALRSAFS